MYVTTRSHGPIVPDATQRRLTAVRKYGSFPLAYSTLQAGLKYFGADESYIAYDEIWGLRFALADPVAPAAEYETLINRFADAHPRTVFCNLSRRGAAILERKGFYINEMGVEVVLDLASYDFTGRKKAKFRQAARKLDREGYSIEERTADEVDLDEVKAVSDIWRQGRVRGKFELRFLTRPIVFEDEPDVRKFYLFDKRGKIVSFVFFDPVYDNTEVIGYSTAFKRRLPEAPTGAEEGLMKFVIEKFQIEGKSSVDLGLLPLYELEDREFRSCWPLHYAGRAYYRFGSRLFNCKGHADYKHRFRGTHRKVYFATRRAENSLRLVALVKLCRAF